MKEEVEYYDKWVADVTTIISDILKLNLEITRSANRDEIDEVKNLSIGINNSLESIGFLIKDYIKRKEKLQKQKENK